MGKYVNPHYDKFEISLNSEIYVDKTGLIPLTNKFIRTERRFICVSRPRRFGKTMATSMPHKFSNDMITFNSSKDVLALLIHLGYLTFNFEQQTVKIPNEEIKSEFIHSIEDNKDWKTVTTGVSESQKLL